MSTFDIGRSGTVFHGISSNRASCYWNHAWFTQTYDCSIFFFIPDPIWENDPFWLIFFRWLETTNQFSFDCFLIVFLSFADLSQLYDLREEFQSWLCTSWQGPTSRKYVCFLLEKVDGATSMHELLMLSADPGRRCASLRWKRSFPWELWALRKSWDGQTVWGDTQEEANESSEVQPK